MDKERYVYKKRKNEIYSTHYIPRFLERHIFEACEEILKYNKVPFCTSPVWLWQPIFQFWWVWLDILQDRKAHKNEYNRPFDFATFFCMLMYMYRWSNKYKVLVHALNLIQTLTPPLLIFNVIDAPFESMPFWKTSQNIL